MPRIEDYLKQVLVEITRDRTGQLLISKLDLATHTSAKIVKQNELTLRFAFFSVNYRYKIGLMDLLLYPQ